MGFSSYSRIKDGDNLSLSDSNSSGKSQDLSKEPNLISCPVSLNRLENLKSQRSAGSLYGLLKSRTGKKSRVSTKLTEYSSLPPCTSPSAKSEANSDSSPSSHHFDIDNPAAKEATWKRQSIWRGKRPAIADGKISRALRRSPGHGDLKHIDNDTVKAQRFSKLHATDTSSDWLSNSTSYASTQASPSNTRDNLNISKTLTRKILSDESPLARALSSRWLSKRSSRRDEIGILDHEDQMAKRIIGQGMIPKIKDVLEHDFDQSNQDLSSVDCLPVNPFDNHDPLVANTRKYEVMSFGRLRPLPETMPIFESMRSASSNGIFDEDSKTCNYRDRDTSYSEELDIESITESANKADILEKAGPDPKISRHVNWSSENASQGHADDFLPEIDFQDSGFFESSMLQTSTPRTRLEPLWTARRKQELIKATKDLNLGIEIEHVPTSSSGRSSTANTRSNANQKSNTIGLAIESAQQGLKIRQSRYPPKDSLQLRSRTNAEKRPILRPKNVNATTKSQKKSLDPPNFPEATTDRSEEHGASGIANQESLKNAAPGRVYSVVAPPRLSSKQMLAQNSMIEGRNHGEKRASA